VRAKFAGECRDCGATILPGDEIKWSKGKGARCADGCIDAEAAAEQKFFADRENVYEIRGFTETTAADHGAGGGDPDGGYW
jgi:hypothetical protein